MSSPNIINIFHELEPVKLLKRKLKEDKFPLFVSPLFGSSKSIFLESIKSLKAQFLILLHDIKEVEELNVELDLLGLSEYIIPITEYRPEYLQEKLTEISNKKSFILLAQYNILNCTFPSKEKLASSTTNVQAGGDLTYNDVMDYLNILNYQRDKFVEMAGDYSVRGSIIDFWSYSEKNPVRLEFDGDFLESIRFFDPENQRSTEIIERTTIAASLANGKETEGTDLFSYLENPYIFASSYELRNLKLDSFNVFRETEKEEVIVPELQEVITTDEEFPEPVLTNEIVKVEEGTHELNEVTSKFNGKWVIEEELGADRRLNLGITESQVVNGNYDVLFNLLQQYTSDGFKVIVTSENELQSNRLKDLLIDIREELAALFEQGKIKIETLPIRKGFVLRKEKFFLLTDYEIFNKPYRTKVGKSKKYRKGKSKSFASIKRGDYVVHEDYGIGKYGGLETIK